MTILYIGDVMGEMGLKVVEKILPEIKREKQIDMVIAQAENVTDGKGVTPADFKRLQNVGVDFCTGGNWTIHNDSIYPLLSDPNVPIIRPANYPSETPGRGYKYFESSRGKVLVISLLGHVVGRDAERPTENPLKIIDEILDKEKDIKRVATIVNFHGDYSSEKFIVGYYLDGKVSAVIGDHWHVPTADAEVLPKGTAHITDVGMCGSLDSSLGVKFENVIPRWHDDVQTRNELEISGRGQFNAVLVEINEQGLAKRINSIRRLLP